MSYQIFTDALADISESMLKDLPDVKMISMQVDVDGELYTYGPDGNLDNHTFYKMLRSGKFSSTSQINSEKFKEAFEPELIAGRDVLYLGFSSGMSGTMNSSKICCNELEEKYPERKIICIDTLCASVGEGFLVQEAARKQAKGMNIEELSDWIMKMRLYVCHWFTVDTFDHLRHGGRVTGVSAAMGTVLNIKPLLHVDTEGKLQVMEKPRGRRKSISRQLDHMKSGWMPEIGNLVVIGHGDCPEDAEQLKCSIQENFPDADIYIAEIGPVIGSHTGPGMLALIYWGNTR